MKKILNEKKCPFRNYHEIWDGKNEYWWISCDYFENQDEDDIYGYINGKKCDETDCPLTDEDFEKYGIECEE